MSIFQYELDDKNRCTSRAAAQDSFKVFIIQTPSCDQIPCSPFSILEALRRT